MMMTMAENYAFRITQTCSDNCKSDLRMHVITALLSVPINFKLTALCTWQLQKVFGIR